jgi:hypothetical protein
MDGSSGFSKGARGTAHALRPKPKTTSSNARIPDCPQNDTPAISTGISGVRYKLLRSLVRFQFSIKKDHFFR